MFRFIQERRETRRSWGCNSNYPLENSRLDNEYSVTGYIRCLVLSVVFSLLFSIHLFFYTSIFLYIYFSIHLFFYTSIFLYIYFSIHLFFYTYIFLYIYFSIYLFFSLSFFGYFYICIFV